MSIRASFRLASLRAAGAQLLRPATVRRSFVRVAQGITGIAALGALSIGGMQLWGYKCFHEPFEPGSDSLFNHPYLKLINPKDNPVTTDSTVRCVALSQLKPELLVDAQNGGTRLIETFCGGMWGSYGYSVQRNLMRWIFQDDKNQGDLWHSKDLLDSLYKPGTVVTHHFVVLEKTPSSMTLRGCIGPSEWPVKPQAVDNLVRLEVAIDQDRQVAEFRFKAITLDGVTDSPVEDPFGGFGGMLHLTYAKMLVEAGVGQCVL